MVLADGVGLLCILRVDEGKSRVFFLIWGIMWKNGDGTEGKRDDFYASWQVQDDELGVLSEVLSCWCRAVRSTGLEG